MDKKLFKIRTGITKVEFAKMVADCFVNVDRPEEMVGASKILTNSDVVNSLAWGEMPNAVGLISRDRYGMALIQLLDKSYFLIKNIYEAIETTTVYQFVGEHNIDMTPQRVWLPAVS